MVYQRPGDRRRQKNSNHLLTGPDFFQPPREKNSLHQRRTEGHFRSLRIGHGEPARMPPGGADKLPLQRLHPVTAMLPGGGEQFLHCLSHFESRCLRQQGPAKTHRHGMGDAGGQSPHQMPLLETGRTAQHAIERHRHDGCIHVFHDALHAALKR